MKRRKNADNNIVVGFHAVMTYETLFFPVPITAVKILTYETKNYITANA